MGAGEQSRAGEGRSKQVVSDRRRPPLVWFHRLLPKRAALPSTIFKQLNYIKTCSGRNDNDNDNDSDSSRTRELQAAAGATKAPLIGGIWLELLGRRYERDILSVSNGRTIVVAAERDQRQQTRRRFMATSAAGSAGAGARSRPDKGTRLFTSGARSPLPVAGARSSTGETGAE